MKEILTKELSKALFDDKQVIAVLVYGSYARNEKNPRDLDICVVLDKKYSAIHMSRKRLNFCSRARSNYDIHIFQQLPLYIRKKVLEEGEIVICKDEDALYEKAFATIKEFGLYEKVYNLYLESIKNG